MGFKMPSTKTRPMLSNTLGIDLIMPSIKALINSHAADSSLGALSIRAVRIASNSCIVVSITQSICLLMEY